MYGEEIHFGKLLLKLVVLNGFDTFNRGDPIGFLCYPGWMCEPSLRKVGQGILKLLIGNGFGTFYPSDLDR